MAVVHANAAQAAGAPHAAGRPPGLIAVPLPRTEWVVAAALGTIVAVVLIAVVAWRLADPSRLPTVESLGGPDHVDSVVPLPPPPPPALPRSSLTADDDVEVPTEIEVEPGASDERTDSDDPTDSPDPAGASAVGR